MGKIEERWVTERIDGGKGTASCRWFQWRAPVASDETRLASPVSLQQVNANKRRNLEKALTIKKRNDGVCAKNKPPEPDSAGAIQDGQRPPKETGKNGVMCSHQSPPGSCRLRKTRLLTRAPGIRPPKKRSIIGTGDVKRYRRSSG